MAYGYATCVYRIEYLRYMKSIGTLQTIIVGLVSLIMSLLTPAFANPDAPDLIDFPRPFEFNVCESEWPTFELNIDAQPGLIYTWNRTDQAILDQLEFSSDNTRVKLRDGAALPQNVSVFLVVEAIEVVSGDPSPPTLITLVLVPHLDVFTQPLDTACVNRPFPISPTNLIEPIQQPLSLIHI